LAQIASIGTEMDALIEKATTVATENASERMAIVTAQMCQAAQISLGFGFFVVVKLLGAAAFGVLSIGRPIKKIADVLLPLANGTREFDIPYTERGDEVGDAARAARAFRDNLVKLEKLEADQKPNAEHTTSECKNMLRELADMFELAIGKIVGGVSSAATEMEAIAGLLTKNVEATWQLSGEVAVASTQASANVQSAASATGEVGASIAEIGRQVLQSTKIAAEAVQQAERTDSRIAELSRSASRIGEVVTLITTIAGQTNFLALNATIEAARAGEAGRGFAVVAAEVKMLATQTAKATETIKSKIVEMQHTTTDSVATIKEISSTIQRISEIASAIAVAVDEQGAATQDIAHNVERAAHGSAQVAGSIAEVNQGASETGAASAKVLQAAKFLSGESRKLEHEVENFLNTVRAA
jgi:methyl-accepting chemotaxis protein